MPNLINSRSVFIVVPAYNESTSLQLVVHQLLANGYTPIVVDDGSAKSLKPFVPTASAFFIRHKVNLGQGAALQTGISFALEKNAAYIVTFDADGQHDAKNINELLQTLIETNSDVVLGSRFMKGSVHNMTGKRKRLLKLARYINYFFSGLLLTDAHNGLRVMTHAAAKKIQLRENRMAHATEILSQIKKNKLKYIEAPATVLYTDYSRQKGQTVWSSFRIFFDILLNKVFK